jgi:hypothetical protein
VDEKEREISSQVWTTWLSKISGGVIIIAMNLIFIPARNLFLA